MIGLGGVKHLEVRVSIIKMLLSRSRSLLYVVSAGALPPVSCESFVLGD